MKFKSLFLIAALALLALPVFAANDSNLSVTQTNAYEMQTNYTSAIDLGSATPNTVWQKAYLTGVIPALANNTNASTTRTFQLQQSTNNSTWVVTTPVIEARLPGVASTGSAATNFYIPIPRTTQRYIRVAQGSVATSGLGGATTNTWKLTVP